MLTSQNNLALVRTELDTIFYQAFNDVDMIPGYADANTEDIFKKMNIDRQAYIDETFAGTGFFSETGETQGVGMDQAEFGYKKIQAVQDWTKGTEISKNYFDDDVHGTYTKVIQDIALKARRTQDNNAFSIFRNAFTTTLTSDGSIFISTSHPLLKGGTQSNYIASALSPDVLNQAINNLVTQKDQSGTIMGTYPSTLLVELSIFKYAKEITDSALIADSGNNNINFFRSAYGFKVYTSPYLSVAAGADTGAWFLMSKNHTVTRMIRQGMVTSLRNWDMSNNRTYFYQANFREAVFVKDYVGVVAGKS